MIDLWATQKTTLTVHEVIAILGVSRRTVYYMIEHRHLVNVGKVRRDTRITIDSVRHVAKTREFLDPIAHKDPPSQPAA